MFKIDAKIKLFEGGKLPEFKTKYAGCADCYCNLASDEIKIPPFGTCLIGLGFAIEPPAGWKIQLDPRSSALNKDHVLVCHGEIDNDYRGELKANIINLDPVHELVIKNGQRICQIQIVPSYQIEFHIVDELSQTERGEGGFGSTGSN